MGYTTKCFVVIFPPCPRAEWMHTVAGKEKKTLLGVLYFLWGGGFLGKEPPRRQSSPNAAAFQRVPFCSDLA